MAMRGIGPMRGSTRRASDRCQGFTLTEVMVAMLLLGLVMGGFLKLATQSARTREAAHNHFIAVIIAHNRIERARYSRMDELPLLAERDTVVNELGAPDPEGRFLRTTALTPDYDDNPLLMRMTVSVHPPTSARGTTARPVETVSTVLTEYLEP